MSSKDVESDNTLVTLSADDLNEKAGPGLEALTKLLESGGSADFAPPPENRRSFLVGWGLLASLHRQACAVVLLHSKGLGHEAAPNRRYMIETMAQLQWLALDGEEAVDAMNSGFQYSHGGLRKAVDASGFEYDAEVAASADSVRDADLPGNSKNNFLKVRPLLDRLDKNLVPVWLSETQFSHPTLTGVRAYFDDSAEDAVVLFAEPSFGTSPDPAAKSPYVAFMLLYLGMEAFNALMVGSPWKTELDRIAAEGGLTNSAKAAG
ncbi:hypothetical protein ACFRKE_09665 [Kitasatospora indigofera]|uniref:hypothetical protein n=1 Tax=Kitasatospora indigofera TaxID=67307 RepID=UPI0036983D37